MHYNCRVMAVIIVLGPQRLRPMLSRVVVDQGIQGRIAAITAGWQEREDEDDELAEHLSGRTVNLNLYRRAEEVQAADPELAAAYRERQNSIKRAQVLYRLRLDHSMSAIRELMNRSGNSEWLDEELDEAFDEVRRLDDAHLERVSGVHDAFFSEWNPFERPAVKEHRKELAEILAGCDAVAVAGGHVAVLLNRLKLFGMDELFDDLPILAWSAGAMALGRRVVMFHDFPPQGFGNAEILDSGLGLYRRMLVMPHARRRLKIDNPNRVTELARRFAPRVCVPLDDGDYFQIDGMALWAQTPMRRLTVKGRVERLKSTRAPADRPNAEHGVPGPSS